MYLNVISDSDRTGIGTIDPQVGMKLANGYKITKVNSQSIVGECNGHIDKFFPHVSIYYTEATCWGFNHPDIDKQFENLAALTRKFRHGESAYQQYVNYGYTPALSDFLEQAGYSFAKRVQAQREVAIAEASSTVHCGQ